MRAEAPEFFPSQVINNTTCNESRQVHEKSGNIKRSKPNCGISYRNDDHDDVLNNNAALCNSIDRKKRNKQLSSEKGYGSIPDYFNTSQLRSDEQQQKLGRKRGKKKIVKVESKHFEEQILFNKVQKEFTIHHHGNNDKLSGEKDLHSTSISKNDYRKKRRNTRKKNNAPINIHDVEIDGVTYDTATCNNDKVHIEPTTKSLISKQQHQQHKQSRSGRNQHRSRTKKSENKNQIQRDGKKSSKQHHNLITNNHRKSKQDHEFQTQCDVIGKDTCYAHHDYTPIQVHNNELFPSLLPSKSDSSINDKKDIDNKTNKHDKNHEEKIWMNIAQSGHQNSIKKQIELQRKREKIRYEMETYTKMEILRIGNDYHHHNQNELEVQLKKDIFDQIQTKQYCGDASEKVHGNESCNNNEDPNQGINIKFGWKMNTYKAEKLKVRWLRALLEERKREEEQERAKKISREGSKERLKLDTGTIDEDCSVSSDCVIDNQSSSSLSSSDDNDDGGSSVCQDSDDEDSISSTSSTSSLTFQYLEQPYPLHYAIMKNDESAVKDLLSLPPGATSRDRHVSVADLKKMEMGELLTLPPALDEETTLSVLFYAILLHRPNIVRVLLSIGRKYHLDYVTSTLSIDDTKNDFKSTSLMIASQFNIDSCVKLLMTYGPRMNIRHPKTGDSALHIACQYSDPSIAKILLSSTKSNRTSSHQRMICRRNKKGETPIHICCSRGQIEIIDILLRSCSASCTAKALEIEDNKGFTPLLSAIEAGHTNVVLHLLSWRSNVKCSDVISKSCITLAVTTKSYEMVSLLIDCLDSNERYDLSEALYVALRSFCYDSSAGLDIIQLLVNAGADPFGNCPQIRLYDQRGRCYSCNNPLSIAVCDGQVDFVVCMLDTFFAAQRKHQRDRRMDRILQRRPESYFVIKEKLENEKCQKIGQDAITTALLLCRRGGNEAERDEILCTNRLGCCLVMFRRGIYLDQLCLDQVIKEFNESNESAMSADENTFMALYAHKISEYRKTNIYSRNFASYWSKVFMSLDWTNMNDGNIACPWYQSHHKMNTSQKHQTIKRSDEIFLVIGEKRIIAHKAILSSKSAKLEAAIRFAEMNMEKEIKLDIDFELVKLMLQHCYHGCCFSGLSVEPDIRCQQLIDLYMLGQEYICTSLSLECEMRLLSCDPHECYCWNCCERLERMNSVVVNCHCVTKGPSATLTSENLLGFIAQLEEMDHNQNNYSIAVGKGNGTEKVLSSLEVLSSTSWMSLLAKFPEVLRTNSYLSAVHSTMREYSEQKETEHLECFGDQIGALLLQNCIDALSCSKS